MKTIRLYLFAMNATAFQSAAQAVYLFCSAAGVHVVAPGAVQLLTLKQLVWIFLIAFGRSVLKYVNEHPVTELLAPPAVPPPAAVRPVAADVPAASPIPAGNPPA